MNQLQEFELEQSRNCDFDYLEVLDGLPTKAKLLEKMCSVVYPETVTSTTNGMYLHFVSDRNIGGTSFNISYTIHSPYRKFSTSLRYPSERFQSVVFFNLCIECSDFD